MAFRARKNLTIQMVITKIKSHKIPRRLSLLIQLLANYSAGCVKKIAKAQLRKAPSQISNRPVLHVNPTLAAVTKNGTPIEYIVGHDADYLPKPKALSLNQESNHPWIGCARFRLLLLIENRAS